MSGDNIKETFMIKNPRNNEDKMKNDFVTDKGGVLMLIFLKFDRYIEDGEVKKIEDDVNIAINKDMKHL